MHLAHRDKPRAQQRPIINRPILSGARGLSFSHTASNFAQEPFPAPERERARSGTEEKSGERPWRQIGGLENSLDNPRTRRAVQDGSRKWED